MNVWRLATLASAVLLLAACGSTPVVYAPGDMEGQPPTGTVTALKKLLANDAGPVRLVFMHGVGDHCYGYALGDDGWLGTRARDTIGLTAGALSADYRIPVDVFMGGSPDAHSYMQYATRSYESTGRSLPRGLHIDAVEITWSPLTQWLKTTQLYYDSSSAFAASSRPSCLESPDPKVVPDIKHPPQRLLLDQLIKEQLFDRNLADAIIYAGRYAPVLERGVAEALCHAITNQPPNARCRWPDPSTDAHRYVFVTHSLGSRILYDTLINLLDYDPFGKGNPFAKGDFEPDDTYLKAAAPFVAQMVARTPAIYMMANQLSLMGLADTPAKARSSEGPKPYFVIPPLAEIARVGPRPLAALDASTCRSAPNVLGRVRDAQLGPLAAEAPALQFVAFNDTNDLLTWHIPRWYSNEGEDECRPNVRFSNVFVQNATHWLVLEGPLSAHQNYFTRSAVWRVMLCGASGEVVGDCL